ncbi:MAG: class I SAM-dependent methyltransferase [Euryarchaeota archaeon]|nr:class I SAM-dependent methyltransferase [Euryarchaeota archaeon]
MQYEKLKEDSEGLIERAEILKRWEVKDKLLLDLGAGPLAIIATRDFNCKVTNIDISEAALSDAKRDAANEGVAGRIRFDKVDATSLPYQNGCFEVVISYGVLHHIEIAKRRRFIQEACRVASERVIVAELTLEGFQRIHAVSNFQVVNLERLETELNSHGEVDKYVGTLMRVYTLFLFTKENLC